MSSSKQHNRGRDPRSTQQRNRSGPNRSKHGKGSNRSRHPRSRHSNNNPRHQRREPANASNEVASAPPGLAAVEETNLPPIDEQRQIYAYTRCVGMHCEVEETGGRTLSGIFHTAHVGSQSPSPQSISLQMLQDMKTGKVMNEDEHFILNGDTWVQMRVPGLNLLKQDKKANAKSSTFGTDAEISGRTQIQERTLKTCDWLSGAESGLISGLEDQDPMAESGAGLGKWDQFEANKDLKVNDVTYNENTMTNFYTTSLRKSDVSEAKRLEVERIAQEIEKSKALRPVDTRDDEDRYSAVQRPVMPNRLKRDNVQVNEPRADVAPEKVPTTAAVDSEVTKEQPEAAEDVSGGHTQVSTNTFNGLKKFQAKRERQRQDAKAAAEAEAAKSTPTTTSFGTDTSKIEEPKSQSTEKPTETITPEATAKTDEKQKKIVLKANAPSFTPTQSMRTQQPPAMQTMPPPSMMFNYQHGAYPPGPQHYPARAHGPNAGVHRASMYSQQRFPTSRHPGFAPRGYPPSHNYMHNPPRAHTMPPNAMHPQRMGYPAGHGPPHNRNGIGGMHQA